VNDKPDSRALPREAVMGDNGPPEPTPIETLSERVNDLYNEALNWLDKDPIENEAQAEQVTRLKGMLSEVKKIAEAERKAEKQPFLDGGRAVDAKWKPVIDMAEKAAKAAARKLTPWLQAVEAEKARIAREEREKAEQALRDAKEAQRLVEQGGGDMAEIERAEEALRIAKEQQMAARMAAQDKANIRTDEGGATLRTYWLLKVTDDRALLKHYLVTDPDWVRTIMRERAEKDMRAGARDIPGTIIWSEKRAI